MKLGLSPLSYIFKSGFFSNSSANDRPIEILDLPLRYYQPRPEEFMVWYIQRSDYYHEKYGLECIVIAPTSLDAAYLDRLKNLVKGKQIFFSHLALRPDFESTEGLYYVAPPDRFREGLPKIAEYMEAAERLGLDVIGTENPAWLVRRFRKDIHLETQLERYAQNIKQVVERAASFNFRYVMIKNSGDYQAGELIRIIKGARCDNLMINFDTGNPMLVWEDPVEAAQEAAPYTVSTHLKDNYMHALTWYGLKIRGTPIGKGQVDFAKILDIFEKKSPDPKNLPLNIEVMAPEGDEDRLVEESLGYVREHFGSYLK